MICGEIRDSVNYARTAKEYIAARITLNHCHRILSGTDFYGSVPYSGSERRIKKRWLEQPREGRKKTEKDDPPPPIVKTVGTSMTPRIT